MNFQFNIDRSIRRLLGYFHHHIPHFLFLCHSHIIGALENIISELVKLYSGWQPVQMLF